MASLGQIIFYSMITLIFLFAAIIIIILALAFSDTISEVMSSNPTPTANLGDDVLLSCILNSDSLESKFKQVSVVWKKKSLSGEVYRYADGAPKLDGQNSQFKGRTQLFHDDLVKGNASLLLRDVRRSDQGVYTCTIRSSGGGGSVSVHLRVAGFSAPTFTFSNGELTAKASRWFPKPAVTWTGFEGNVLSGTTSFTQNSAEIFSLVSTLLSVNVSDVYTCKIENELVASISSVTLTGTDSDVSVRTYFTFSAASSRLTSTYLSVTTSILYICYLI